MFGLSGRQIFILTILVLLLVAGTQYGPAYFAAFQVNDFVHQEVTFAVTNRKTPEALRAEIVQRANELGFPVKPKDIRITRRGPSFMIEFEYRWPINMKLYRHELVFHSVEQGELFDNASD